MDGRLHSQLSRKSEWVNVCSACVWSLMLRCFLVCTQGAVGICGGWQVNNQERLFAPQRWSLTLRSAGWPQAADKHLCILSGRNRQSPGENPNNKKRRLPTWDRFLNSYYHTKWLINLENIAQSTHLKSCILFYSKTCQSQSTGQSLNSKNGHRSPRLSKKRDLQFQKGGPNSFTTQYLVHYIVFFCHFCRASWICGCVRIPSLLTT